MASQVPMGLCDHHLARQDRQQYAGQYEVKVVLFPSWVSEVGQMGLQMVMIFPNLVF